MALRTAYWAMHRSTEASFTKRTATADQFVLLSLLAEQDGITQQELVRRASSDANTIRAMLVLLERRHLVTRERHPTDGRARSVALTRKGRQTYEKLWAQSDPLRERLRAGFGAREAKTLVRLLLRIVRECEDAGKRQTGPALGGKNLFLDFSLSNSGHAPRVGPVDSSRKSK